MRILTYDTEPSSCP